MSQPFRKCLSYDIPVSEGFTAFLQLPRDLTLEEAEKLCASIRTLAIPERPVFGGEETR